MIAIVRKSPLESGWGKSGLNPNMALQVFGMRRAGNHAVINWIMRNPPENSSGTIFLNNCRPWRDPVESRKSLEVNGKRRGDKTDTMATAGSSPLVVVSYEDCPPPAADVGKSIMRGFKADDVDHVVVVYRGFLNWSASLLKKLRGNPGYSPVTRSRILLRSIEQYAEVLDRLKYPNVIGICYDAWVTAPAYRAEKLGQLGLPVKDNALGDIQRYGGGSSFQQEAAKGQDLGAHKRWIEMVEDSEYLVMLWTVAQDAAFLAVLQDHFPDDVELLKPLVNAHPGLGAAL